MTNLPNLNLQTYNPSMQVQYPAYQQGVYNLNMQGLDYDTLKLQAKDSALGQVTRQYESATPEMTLATMLKSLVSAALMGIGFSHSANWFMSAKDVASGISNAKHFESTRLYKASNYLDKKLANSSVMKGLISFNNKIKGFFETLAKPEPIRQLVDKMKMGSVAVLDKTGMYYMGQGAEGLNQFVDDLASVPTDKIKSLLAKNGVSSTATSEVLEVIKNFKQGRIRGNIAFDKLYKTFSKLPAKELSELNKQGLFGNIIGVRTDLNSGLHKARFFNSAKLTSQGPIAKLMQKTTGVVGQATSNGLLGGKMALLMGTFGLMQGFTAASNAEKGDKLKAFMEDYIGFTLGSYIMSMVVGTWFNKFLGVSEVGMDVTGNAFKSAIKSLGLDSETKRVQDAVIAYNKEYKAARKASSIIEKMKNNKIPKEKAFEQIKKLVESGNLKIDMPSTHVLLDSKVSTRLKVLGEVNSQLKQTMKSSIKFSGGIGKYLIQKPFEVVGKLLSVGRYDLIEGKKFSAKSFAKFSKRFGGGLGRALLVGFVLVEPFRKGFMKLSHSIFGKPKNSALDEGKTTEKETTQQNVMQNQSVQQQTQMMPQQNIQQNQQTGMPKNQSQMQNMNTSLNESQSIASSPINQNQVENDIAATELSRSYIPSSQPSPYAMQKDPREVEVEQAIMKAESAERAAQSFLSRGI